MGLHFVLATKSYSLKPQKECTVDTWFSKQNLQRAITNLLGFFSNVLCWHKQALCLWSHIHLICSDGIKKSTGNISTRLRACELLPRLHCLVSTDYMGAWVPVVQAGTHV